MCLFCKYLRMVEFTCLRSNSNESGSFSTDGIEQRSLSNDTFVQCTTTHLTSFAVLVDTSGESVSLTSVYTVNST